jgi:His/Glu/Gln/Arg/opine family amino acid ABC transporter permease subunit
VIDLAFTQTIVGRLLDGLLLTIPIVLVAAVAGNLLALPLALARTSRNPLLRVPAYVYILFMRGTPLIVQMFMIYYGLAQFREVRTSVLWPVLRDPVWCAMISLTLNTAAYSAEVLRGAIQSVPKGLVEAGRSMGLSRWLVFRFVILPTALRQSIPAFANETVLLLKASAIVFTITVRDVMGEANIVRAQTFRTYEPLLAAAVLYLALTFAIVRGFALVERRLNRHAVPADKASLAKALVIDAR